MRLFIAEKPSVAKAIVAELGYASRDDGFTTCKDGSIVTWCFGHLLEQAEPDAYLPNDVPRTKKGTKVWRFEDLPIFPETWKVLPKDDRSVKKQLATIGKLLKKASLVVHAGDPDREGQLLVDEVLEHFQFSGRVQRFWVSAQDSVSIRKGLANLRDNGQFVGMKLAALGRSRADWLLGMNLSRFFTLRERERGSDQLIAVGRVQTPTLALVAQRDRAIRNFKPVPYFVFKAYIQGQNPFEATWKPSDEQGGLDESSRLIDMHEAERLFERFRLVREGTVIGCRRTIKKQAQPKAYSLADIQLDASNKFGFSAEETLKLCQSLYEKHKVASYPRTDCGFLPESQHCDAADILNAVGQTWPHAPGLQLCDVALKAPVWNDKKITAHHGIIPTRHFVAWNSLSGEEQKIYTLIARRYLALFLPQHEYEEREISLCIAGEVFVARGKRVIKAGWKAVYGAEESSEEDGEKSQLLPDLRQGTVVTVREVVRSEEKTKAPPAFTEGTLIRAMENIHTVVDDPASKQLLKDGDGIGTPATRAAILSELKRKKYLVSQGKNIHATDSGLRLLQAVPEILQNPTLTAVFERLLQDVEHGTASLDSFLDRQKALILSQIQG